MKQPPVSNATDLAQTLGMSIKAGEPMLLNPTASELDAVFSILGARRVAAPPDSGLSFKFERA